MWSDLKESFLSLFFPKFCFGCQKEGSYLCHDCIATLEISQCQYCLCQNPKKLIGTTKKGKCPNCRQKKLDGLYSALPYQGFLTKNLIKNFKYEPFIRKLSFSLSSLIISHFQLLEKMPDFSDFFLIPVPLAKKRLKWRGFNQAEEIGKELSSFLKIPLVSDVLTKTKENPPQIELSGKEREENVKGCFRVQNNKGVGGKKILLIDDVYTTGSTMEECATKLLEAGAKEIWGVAIARG